MNLVEGRLIASKQSCRCLVPNRIIIYCLINSKSCNWPRNQNLKFFCHHILLIGKSIEVTKLQSGDCCKGGDIAREASLGILVAVVIKVWHLYYKALCGQYTETQVWLQNHVLNLGPEMLYAKDAKVDILICQHLACELAHSWYTCILWGRV